MEKGSLCYKIKVFLFLRTERSHLQTGVFSLLNWSLYCDKYQWVSNSKSERNRLEIKESQMHFPSKKKRKKKKNPTKKRLLHLPGKQLSVR